MNNKLLMDNYLLVLKSTVEVYVHGTLESSNENVRSILKSCLNDTLSSQAATYDEMVDFGWYKVTNVESDKINQTIQKLEKCN